MREQHRQQIEYIEALARAKQDLIQRMGQDAQRRMTQLEREQSSQLVSYIESQAADLKALGEKGLLTDGIIDVYEERFEQHVAAMHEITDQTKRALIDTVAAVGKIEPPASLPEPAQQPMREIPAQTQQPVYVVDDYSAMVMWWETTHGMKSWQHHANWFEKASARAQWPSVRDAWAKRQGVRIEG